MGHFETHALQTNSGSLTRIAALLMVMMNGRRRGRHWYPIQQTAGPRFGGGQLSIIAKVCD